MSVGSTIDSMAQLRTRGLKTWALAGGQPPGWGGGGQLQPATCGLPVPPCGWHLTGCELRPGDAREGRGLKPGVLDDLAAAGQLQGRRDGEAIGLGEEAMGDCCLVPASFLLGGGSE